MIIICPFVTLTSKRKDMKYTLPGVGDSGDWVACNAAVANKLGAVAAVMYAEGYTYCGMLKSEEKNSSLYKKVVQQLWQKVKLVLSVSPQTSKLIIYRLL